MLSFRRDGFLAVLLLAGCLVSVAAAQVVDVQILGRATSGHPKWQPRKPATQPAPESQLQALFQDLAASDAAARDRAFSALLDLTRADLPALRKVVERARPVAPSQAGALREIVTHVYLSAETYDCEPRIGFLGLILPALESVEVPLPEAPAALEENGLVEIGRANTGVPIDYRIPGFCAFRALREGDVVLGVTAPVQRRMRDWGELTRGIQSFPAGRRITLQVLRRGAVLNVPLTLDAKPLLALGERTWSEVVLPAREAAAEKYWAQHFAPLIDERAPEVSSAGSH
ncbi:MAG TPA: hypothetical protein VGR35_11860 [Tepidisphaeraceae bacterium]|nr:hypothetical protein [Tepidisphaeraceae bacterium]